MKSLYRDDEAAEYVRRYAHVAPELALRVYTSRLIGRDPALVMHGGGNTSVKGTQRTLLGEHAPAIFVKGSGSNLDAIEPAGLPGLDLEYLRRLRALEKLGDEEMVNQLRTHLFHADAPNPSVETLLHAFLPHRFIDHSHADAILALTNRPDGEALCRRVFGKRVGIVPYVMPGFALARLCAEVFERDPGVEGLVLLKHGLFTFGDTARESYDRHIALVTEAERQLAREAESGRKLTLSFDAPADAATLAARVAPLLRGQLAEATGDADLQHRRMVLEWRASDEILDFVNAREFVELALTGPLTPDHVIRTKELPCIVAEPGWNDDRELEEQLAAAITAYRRAYNQYFERCSAARGAGVKRTRLDDFPRVVLLPGAGLFAFGASKKDARIAADIAEHTLRVKMQVCVASTYEALPEADLFDVEYWPLEQAKLGKTREKPLARQVALVTGAAGAIGSAVAERLIEEGAHVVLADISAERLSALCDDLAARYSRDMRHGVVCDVTSEAGVKQLFEEAARHFGGCDIVVPNAGIAASRPLDALELEDWQRVQRVNVDGYFLVLREAARQMRRQGTGGNIVVVGSKNTMAPGAEFGAYSASKAAGHQLAKVAALELAKDGIRVNIVAPDAVFGTANHPSGLWAEVGPDRAKAHGIDPSRLEEHYQARNLLRARVTGRHVGNAVVFFAAQQTPTTGATLPVDGGIAAAFPR